MYSVMPSTFASFGCRRRITSLAIAVALVERLQIDLDPAAVERRVGAVDADERRQALDGRILENHVRASACCRSAIAANETDLRRFGDAENHARVLHREEALRARRCRAAP